MSEFRDIFRQFGWRLLLALPFFVLGAGGRLIGAPAEANPLGAGLAAGLLSTASILVGAIIVARPLARLAAEPWGALFFPSAQFDKPQPMYGIPEARRKEGKFEEAIAGFAGIAEQDPQEVRAYAAMIDVAIVNLKDLPRGEAILAEGLTALTQREDRERLITCFTNSRSMLRNDRDGVPERALISTERMKRRPT